MKSAITLERIEQALTGRWPESRLEPTLDRIGGVMGGTWDATNAADGRVAAGAEASALLPAWKRAAQQ